MTKVLGVDLAYCNVIADGGYQVMYDGGVRFAYIKQTQGNRIYDSQFDKHWKGVSDTKILRGVYHVYEPLVLAKQQMNFINPVCPLSAELPFALDVEIDLQATNAYLLKEVHDFLVLLEEHFGRKPIIYTGKWWWEPNMSPAAPWVGNYDLWIASYPYASGRIDTTWEKLPSYFPVGWNDPNRWITPITRGRKPKIWQFSGDKFWLPKINGALDLNLFDGDETALRVWAGLEPPVPDWRHQITNWSRTKGYTGRDPE